MRTRRRQRAQKDPDYVARADLEDRAFRFIMGVLALLSPTSQVRVFERIVAILGEIHATAAKAIRKIPVFVLLLLDLL